MRAILIISTLALAGCVQEPPVQKVTVKGDTYCKIAKPITYSKRDSKDTISQIRKHNRSYDRVC